MIIYTKLARGRSILPTDFADITSIACTGITVGSNSWVKVEFASDLTTTQQEAVRRRCSSGSGSEESVRASLKQLSREMAQWPVLPSPPTQEDLRWRMNLLILQVRNVVTLFQMADDDGENSPSEPPPV